MAPILRGLLSLPAKSGGREAAQRFVFEFRTGPEILAYVARQGGRALQPAGPSDARPRHPHQGVPLSCRRRRPASSMPSGRTRRRRSTTYVADYHAYFARHNAQADARRRPSSTRCRASCWCRALGLFGLGNTSKDAKIAADLAETTVAVIADAERLGTYECIPEPDIFDIEYWSLEQAKLGAAAEKPLARRIVVVTGGGSGIGAATAAAFAARRRRGRGARSRRRPRSKGLRAIACDVTDAAAGARRLRQGRGDLRRRRYRRLQRGRGLAGHDRRCRRGDVAQKLRAQFLGAPERGAERRAHHAGAGTGRLPAVQHVEAGGQSRAPISAPTACPRPRPCS